MKKLESFEIELIGEWVREGGQVRANEACDRIHWLVTEVLTQVGVDKGSGGWDKLFRDPADGRYWLLTYPHSEMHGGGPPALKQLSITDQDLDQRFISPSDWKKQMEKSMESRHIRLLSEKDPPSAE
jgi:hypothetical protein